MKIERTAVQSSNIVSAGYDPESQTMVIEFRTGLYRYEGVPQSDWDFFMEAPSKGSHFSRVLRPFYEGIPFEEDDEEVDDGPDDEEREA